MEPTHETAAVVRPQPSPTLDHLALLRVTGADARTFLDGQLTRNVPADEAAGASPFGYCSPKGRLLASGIVWTDGDAVFLVLSRDVAVAVAKRLRMYVLRAKAAIDDLTESQALAGLVDPVADPFPALSPWGVARVDGRTWIRHPDAGAHRRYLRIGGGGDDIAGVVHDATWRWLEIRAGLPRVGAATQDRFVPQMLNLEALGGVDFRKGCFPGQEVVARSQYLGKLKRRTALGSLDPLAAVPAPGTDILDAGQAEPVGLVVDAERGPDGRVALLAELPVTLFASAALRVGTHDGPPLALEPLPYPLPDNEVFVRPKL